MLVYLYQLYIHKVVVSVFVCVFCVCVSKGMADGGGDLLDCRYIGIEIEE